MGRFGFNQRKSPTYLQIRSHVMWSTRPCAPDASAVMLPMQYKAHWKPSRCVLVVTCWKLIILCLC